MEVPRANRILNDLYKAQETHRRTPGQAIQGTWITGNFTSNAQDFRLANWQKVPLDRGVLQNNWK